MSGDAPPAAAHQSTGSAVPGLDDATVDSLASRLADDASMALPGSLSGQVQDDAPARSKRVEYLHALLQRDPGVFLGRACCVELIYVPVQTLWLASHPQQMLLYILA